MIYKYIVLGTRLKSKLQWDKTVIDYLNFNHEYEMRIKAHKCNQGKVVWIQWIYLLLLIYTVMVKMGNKN